MREAADQHRLQTRVPRGRGGGRPPAGRDPILGLLDDLRPKSSGTSVTPVIAEIVGQPTLHAQEAEVARIHPHRLAQDPARWETEEIEWKGERWPITPSRSRRAALGDERLCDASLLTLCPGGSPISVQWLLDRRPLSVGESAGVRAELHRRLQEG